MTITEDGQLPDGVTLTDNGDGSATLAGTPEDGSGDTYNLTVTASNGVDPDATQDFQLVVLEAPTILSSASTTFVAGQAGTFDVSASGYGTGDDPNTMTISETGSLPNGVSFTDNGDGTATLSGTPAGDSGGTYKLMMTASNGVDPDATQDFVLTVTEGLTITSGTSTTFTVGQAGTFDVTTAGGDPSDAVVLSKAGNLPEGVTFDDNGDGTATLAGTPDDGSAGTYDLTFTASNGVDPDATQDFVLTVTAGLTITSAPRPPSPQARREPSTSPRREVRRRTR